MSTLQQKRKKLFRLKVRGEKNGDQVGEHSEEHAKDGLARERSERVKEEVRTRTPTGTAESNNPEAHHDESGVAGSEKHEKRRIGFVNWLRKTFTPHSPKNHSEGKHDNEIKQDTAGTSTTQQQPKLERPNLSSDGSTAEPSTGDTGITLHSVLEDGS
ncbi:unnamed protein product [Dicrocoelium dendriticum]|nr:unnamed protein product [Dicrocoelium dendriticum]